LVALGLAVIFGMMGIINLAQGEFIMIGVYATAISYHAGVPLIGAMLVGGLATGILGVVLERSILHRLYHRSIDSMVATWGISLILINSMLIIFGSSYPSVPTPLGSVRYGSFSASVYRIALAGAAVVMLLGTYYIFKRTEFGLHARAAMQDAETARSLGIDTPKLYTLTFFFGSVLTGLAGSLLAPIVQISPDLGGRYVVEAFVTVIVGGANVLIGTTASASLLSIINGIGSQSAGTLIGRVLLLVAAIIVIRIQPKGISEYFVRGD
jgi:branched-chain amino acid transport system permease protein